LLPIGAHGLQIANLVLRKFAHVFEFFVMGVLLYRALPPTVLTPENRAGLEAH
jgi:hypothetical protein